MIRIDNPTMDKERSTVGKMGIHSRDVTGKKSEPLMSVKELAAYLNVKESWVYAQIREARRSGFPVIKVGKYRRFRRKDVMDWCEENNRNS
jgi:excisionase family DNA binding protein